MEMQIQDSAAASATDDSRRAFLKKAVIAGWAAPMIVSVTASRALANHAGACHQSTEACDSLSTTPEMGQASCCSPLVCCPTPSPFVDTCRGTTGATCSGANAAGNAMCCSNNCAQVPGVGFRCAA